MTDPRHTPPAGASERVRRTGETSIPGYDTRLSMFHDVFERELESILDALPLRAEMRVLDLACGDGFYTRRIARRLGRAGSVTGVDINLAYLSRAEDRSDGERSDRSPSARIDYVAASFDRLAFPDDTFDLVWCAQSLYSLPDPVVAVAHMARVLRPGGLVAVLENDTLHQVLLPWPVRLELPLRAAELQALVETSRNSNRYYVGRRLPAVLAAAGLVPVAMTTHAFDRQAPLGNGERALLQGYLEEVSTRVGPHLSAEFVAELQDLVDPASSAHLLAQPHLTLTWLNVLALGRKPGG